MNLIHKSEEKIKCLKVSSFAGYVTFAALRVSLLSVHAAVLAVQQRRYDVCGIGTA
jgi:hypothetical protein